MNTPVQAKTSMTMRRLLALATLATAGGVAASTAFAAPADNRMHGPGMAGSGLNQRMLEKVGASSEQRATIEQIMTSARNDLRSQHDQGKALQTQMRSLFAQPEIDEAAIESLRQQMLTQHDAASRRMTQAMVEASRVLTAEQRQQLATMMAERAGRHGRPGADDRRHGG